jgi:peroxidase
MKRFRFNSETHNFERDTFDFDPTDNPFDNFDPQLPRGDTPRFFQTPFPAGDDVISNFGLGFDDVISYSIDGTGNNLADPTLGGAGTDETRIAAAHFAPGTTDTPVNGPDPRVISNALFANDQDLNDPGGRSAYTYAFGQFIDHDLDMNPDQTPAADGSNTLQIVVPPGDAFFTPGSTINILRGQIDPANGNAINAVTSFLDLSQVYGSDAATAASLRNADGTLKTQDGGLPIGPDGQFMAGDVRVGENPDLTAMDVLFVREHNYWVAKLHAENPGLSGDQLYSMARAITTAEYQNIIYSEYLPSLLGRDAPGAYQGYDPNVNPSIMEEFSTAAFRFGHTIISPTETKIASDGTVLQTQDLIAAAGEPSNTFQNFGGADALLRNLAQDTSQQAGVSIISDLLNMLDANPNDMGDLGAIDVERERDLGINTLNQTRLALGLPAYTSFHQITSNTALAAELKSVYGSVNNLDLFVGGLAEDADTANGSMLGPTFSAIISEQFANLRAGDRLYFENQGFSPALMSEIQNTTLSDLILRDTDTTAIQADAFVATERHASDVASPDPSKPQLVIGIDADGAVIAGSPGVANTIVAGQGLSQILTGGGTSDTFEFLGSGHYDTVTDFNPAVDTIDFEGSAQAASFRDLTIHGNSAGGAVVAFGGNSVTLTGVDPASLSARNFLYNQDDPALAASPPSQFGA